MQQFRTEPATIVHRDPTLQIATWRDLVVQRWSESGGAESLRTAQRVQRDVVATRKNRKLYLLAWLQLAHVSAPDDETRKALAESRREIGPHLAASAVILEGSGFGASIIRGMISSQRLFQRSAYPTVVKATVAEAAGFLAHLMTVGSGQVTTASQIEDVIADLRARVDATSGGRLSRPLA